MPATTDVPTIPVQVPGNPFVCHYFSRSFRSRSVDLLEAVLCGVQMTAWRRVSEEGRDRAPRAYHDRENGRRRTDE